MQKSIPDVTFFLTVITHRYKLSLDINEDSYLYNIESSLSTIKIYGGI